jgi:hypothetical protein
MFKILKTIATELKRANDLKQRDIENKEKCNWYYQMTYHPTTTVPVTHFSSNGDNPFVAQSTGTGQSMSGNPYLDNLVKEGKAK